MVKKIVIANLISAGIVTVISLAAMPVTMKISGWVVNKMFEK